MKSAIAFSCWLAADITTVPLSLSPGPFTKYIAMGITCLKHPFSTFSTQSNPFWPQETPVKINNIYEAPDSGVLDC